MESILISAWIICNPFYFFNLIHLWAKQALDLIHKEDCWDCKKWMLIQSDGASSFYKHLLLLITCTVHNKTKNMYSDCDFMLTVIAIFDRSSFTSGLITNSYTYHSLPLEDDIIGVTHYFVACRNHRSCMLMFFSTGPWCHQQTCRARCVFVECRLAGWAVRTRGLPE